MAMCRELEKLAVCEVEVCQCLAGVSSEVVGWLTKRQLLLLLLLWRLLVVLLS